MANLLPFRGVLYDQDVVGDIGKVVAPPYDVIDGDHQRALYARHPENVIRLELGQEEPGDTPDRNRYTRAAQYLAEWLTSGALRRDSVPAVYPYTVEYVVPDGQGPSARKVLTGFLGLMELQDFGPGRVLPHENTRSAAKADRLHLMTACRSNFSPIFSLFSDPEQRAHRTIQQAIAAQKPRIELTDDDGFIHRLWAVSDPQALAALSAELRSKPLFIADGHHRYETALTYQRQRREQEGGSAGTLRRPYDRVLMLCAGLEDPGLTVLPTHRVLKSALPPIQEIRDRLGAEFTCEEIPFDRQGEAGGRRRFLKTLRERGTQAKVFGLALQGASAYYLFFFRHEAEATLGDSPRDRLDVSVLHGRLLSRIGPAELDEHTVIHTKSDDEALDLVLHGSGRAAFLLNPTRVSEVSAVASAGERMPHKSTYFFPKPLTGLVLHVMDEDGP